jgi:hypothetical protein
MEQAVIQFAEQHGPWAAFCVVMFVACCLLVKWVLKASEQREAGLNAVISEQSVVITRQMETIESQSTALNRIADALDRLERRLEK